jgi:hypothetical protein
MQRNAPNRVTRGFKSPELANKTPQETIDELGIAFIPDVLDVDPHADLISGLHDRIRFLADELSNNPVQPSESFGLALANMIMQVKTNDGFTICAFWYFTEPSAQIFASALGLEADGTGEFDIEALERPPVCYANTERRINTPSGAKLATDQYWTHPALEADFFRQLLLTFRDGLVISRDLRDKSNKGFALTFYEPGADLARAQRNEHHTDDLEKSNSVSRAICLSGTTRAAVGINDEALEILFRNPGDEIVMNYLAEGFPVRGPIHDMTNVGETPALNLVLDEFEPYGLEYLNRRGIFDLGQRGIGFEGPPAMPDNARVLYRSIA